MGEKAISGMICRVSLLALLLIGSVGLYGCAGSGRTPGRKARMVVTAYCACGKCCGWKRNLLGIPVVAGGPNKGSRKQLGICADGTRARKGVAAADTDYYPFGTRIYVPGYGWATVHDRGSAIKGPARLDIFFPRHNDALKWGKQEVTVTVYRP